jgi:hypothetical protein
MMAVAGLIGAAAVLLSAVLLLPSPAAVVSLPVAWAPVLAFPFAYGGLVRWNRSSTSLPDPNDVGAPAGPAPGRGGRGERAATLSDLRLWGCEESQGHPALPPLPAADLEEWLTRQGDRPAGTS